MVCQPVLLTIQVQRPPVCINGSVVVPSVDFHSVSVPLSPLCGAITGDPDRVHRTTTTAGASSDGRIHPCEHDESDSTATGFLYAPILTASQEDNSNALAVHGEL